MSNSTSQRTSKLTATKSPLVEQKRKNKREFILRTAAHLFATHGYHSTTMDMLSDSTKLNKGTLYYYYTSKQELLYDICVEATSKHFRVVSVASKMADAEEALNFIIEESIHYIIENRDLTRVYFQESQFFESIFDGTQYKQVRRQESEFMKNIYAVLKNGMSNGQFRSADLRNCGRLIYATILAPYRWRDQFLDGELIVAEAQALIIQGLKKN